MASSLHTLIVVGVALALCMAGTMGFVWLMGLSWRWRR